MNLAAPIPSAPEWTLANFRRNSSGKRPLRLPHSSRLFGLMPQPDGGRDGSIGIALEDPHVPPTPDLTEEPAGDRVEAGLPLKSHQDVDRVGLSGQQTLPGACPPGGVAGRVEPDEVFQLVRRGPVDPGAEL